jgi:hypothetical protein
LDAAVILVASLRNGGVCVEGDGDRGWTEVLSVQRTVLSVIDVPWNTPPDPDQMDA